VSCEIRSLQDGELAAVVAFSLAAWAPVFASLEAEMGSSVFRRIYPDWRAA
jgi:hypothetical protein